VQGEISEADTPAIGKEPVGITEPGVVQVGCSTQSTDDKETDSLLMVSLSGQPG